MSGLGNFMLAMNAHINRDFPYVLAKVGLTAPDGTSHKADHNRYNQRLDSLYMPVFAEEARRFDPTFDDIDFRHRRGDRRRADHARLAGDGVAARRAARAGDDTRPHARSRSFRSRRTPRSRRC